VYHRWVELHSYLGENEKKVTYLYPGRQRHVEGKNQLRKKQKRGGGKPITAPEVSSCWIRKPIIPQNVSENQERPGEPSAVREGVKSQKKRVGSQIGNPYSN